MRYAPVPEDSAIEDRKDELLAEGIATNKILAAQNWGRWRGEVYLTDYGMGVAPFRDVEIRDWVDIVDEEDRRRGLIPDETGESTADTDDSDTESVDGPVARRVVASADVLPGRKQDVRNALRGEVVQSGERVEFKLDDEERVVEVTETEPRSDRYSQDQEFCIGEATHISL